MSAIFEAGSNWESYINQGCTVRVISGGAGAYGADGGIGYLMPTNSHVMAGSYSNDSPKVFINGNIWGLCDGWKIELKSLKKYTVYGEEVIYESNR